MELSTFLKILILVTVGVVIMFLINGRDDGDDGFFKLT